MLYPVQPSLLRQSSSPTLASSLSAWICVGAWPRTIKSRQWIPTLLALQLAAAVEQILQAAQRSGSGWVLVLASAHVIFFLVACGNLS